MTKSKRNIPLEALYPTRSRWQAGDEAIDRLPLSTTLHEAMMVWETAYFEAGGKPGKVKV